MANNEKLQNMADLILEAVGGKANVSNLTHCITRLRFNLKDESIPNDEEVKKIPGVMGVARASGQYQVVIGQTVGDIYAIIGDEIGLDTSSTMTINGHTKKKLTPMGIVKGIFDGLSGSVTPVIPVLVAAAFFKMIVSLLGPTMFGVLTPESDLYVLLNTVGDVGFYFFPVLTGYTAARKFNASPVLGIFIGGLLLHPTLLNLAAQAKTLTVLGVTIHPQNYASTIIPSILSVWVMSYIEQFFKRVIPNSLQIILTPFLTVLVMLPITLGVVGPLGSYLGNFVGQGLLGLSNTGGILGVIAMGLLGGFHQILVMTGMHHVLMTALIISLSESGSDPFVLPAVICGGAAIWGMTLASSIKIKEKEEKGLAFSYFITSIIGGITEPALYGLAVKYKRPFIALIGGGFVGGIVMEILHVTSYSLIPVANLLLITTFIGDTSANIINGVISVIIAFVVSFLLTYFFGFDKNEPVLQK